MQPRMNLAQLAPQLLPARQAQAVVELLLGRCVGLQLIVR